MHSRKKGKSGSKKPLKRGSAWIKYKPHEVEELVVRLAKTNMGSRMIGLELRDQYGIPSVKDATKTKISKIMKKNDAYRKEVPEDLYNLMKKAVNLHAHMDANKRDYTSYRGLELTESKIRRLAKYYIKEGELPKTWKWDLARAKLMIK
jgi:small subunit ribosomal protein S15